MPSRILPFPTETPWTPPDVLLVGRACSIKMPAVTLGQLDPEMLWPIWVTGKIEYWLKKNSLKLSKIWQDIAQVGLTSIYFKDLLNSLFTGTGLGLCQQEKSRDLYPQTSALIEASIELTGWYIITYIYTPVVSMSHAYMHIITYISMHQIWYGTMPARVHKGMDVYSKI